MAEELEREAFEEAAFAQYFLSGIRRTTNPVANAVQIHFEPSKQMNKDEFLAKGADGTYNETTLNAAWWAWKTRAERAETEEQA